MVGGEVKFVFMSHFTFCQIAVFAQVEDEVDEINAKVFTELERKLQE